MEHDALNALRYEDEQYGWLCKWQTPGCVQRRWLNRSGSAVDQGEETCDLGGDDDSDHGGGGAGGVGGQSDDDDGFWSGRLRDRRVAEQVGCRTVVGARDDLGEGRFRDPNVKTFAWWQAALCHQERERVIMKPGHILEGEVSDSDGSIGSGGSGQKRDDDGGSEEEVEWTGRLGGWKKRRMTRPELSSPDMEALWAQWL